MDRETTIIAPADSGAGAIAMLFLALIIVGIVGYCIYAFNGAPTTLIEHNTTTITQPAAPALPAPEAPATN